MAEQHTLSQALTRNFLGHSPNWYRLTIVGFLVLNPILFQINATVAAWVLVLEFIYTVVMTITGLLAVIYLL